MKKIFLLLLFGAIFLSLSLLHAKDWNTYKGEHTQKDSKKTLFSVEYPSDWEPDSIPELDTEGWTTVEFISPEEGPGDVYRERVVLEIEDWEPVPKPSLIEYIKAQNIEFPELVPGVTEIERGTDTVAGKEAFYVIYTGTEAAGLVGPVLKYKTYAFIDSNTETVYTLEYSALPEKYDDFSAVAEKMIRSIKLSSARPAQAGEGQKDKGERSAPRMATFKSGEFDGISFHIIYPLDWELSETSPYIIAFLSPDDIKVAVLVEVQNLREEERAPMTQDEYMKWYDENVVKETDDYKVTDRVHTRFAGHNAVLTTYSYTDTIDPNWHLKCDTFIFLVDGIFVVRGSYMSTPEKYDKYLQQASRMIRSLRLYKGGELLTVPVPDEE
jgi:hypothetical protein